MLNNAIISGDSVRIADILSIIFSHEFFTEETRFIKVLREVITDIFSGLPRQQLLQQVRNRDMHGFGGVAFNSRGAHYEEDSKGQQVVKSFLGRTKVNFRMTSDQMRVLVRMKFVQGAHKDRLFLFTGKDQKGNNLATVFSGWLKMIDHVWNNQFVVTNGFSKLALEFVPIVVSGADDSYTNTVRIFTDKSLSCNGRDKGRSNQGCWFSTEDGKTIAHEFGHMIGASDEYKLPAAASEIPDAILKKISKEDLPLTTVKGIGAPSSANPEAGRDIDNSIMNDEHTSLKVHERHVLRLVKNINSKLAVGVPTYKIRRK